MNAALNKTIRRNQMNMMYQQNEDDDQSDQTESDINYESESNC